MNAYFNKTTTKHGDKKMFYKTHIGAFGDEYFYFANGHDLMTHLQDCFECTADEIECSHAWRYGDNSDFGALYTAHEGNIDKAFCDFHNPEWVSKSYGLGYAHCSYDVNDKSYKKKPNIGLVEKYIKVNKIDPKKSYVVGDRWRDIDFAHNLNCKSIFINRKYKEKLNKKPNYICISTIQAINIILQNEK